MNSNTQSAHTSIRTLLKQARRERAIRDNKSRLGKLFYSGPKMSPEASLPELVDDEPNYMGFPLDEYEDEPPCSSNEQYGDEYE